MHMGLTKDRDIRLPLELWLRDLHRNEPDTAFIHELKMPRPSARVDLAVVNGEFIGYEIKSDLDRLDRLTDQVPAFTNVFEKINLVTTQKHLKSARNKIPNSWGIILFEQETFNVRRKAKKNTKLNFTSLLFSLTVAELESVCRQANFPYAKAWLKEDLVNKMSLGLKKNKAIPFIRDEIRLR